MRTPRSAWRNDAGSARSPSAICTRTRAGPSRRGSRTRQRTASPRPVSRGSSADPTRPVAPVSRSTVRSLECRARSTPLTTAERTTWHTSSQSPASGTKDNSCVEVCPVDCIHPTPDEPDYDKVEQLYIDPEECIDCDACVEACPVDACFAEDQLPDEWTEFAQRNSAYFAGK